MSDAEAALAADLDLLGSGRERRVERALLVLREHLPLAPARLLEAACQTAVYGEAAARLGWRVVGVDASAAAVAQARLRAPHVDLRVGDPLELVRVAGGGFDAVVCMDDGLARLPPPALPAVLAQLRACCRPGGTVLAEVREAGEALRSGVWRDDPECRVSARYERRPGGPVRELIDVEDAHGRRTHERTLYPVGQLELEAAFEAAGIHVAGATRAAGWVVVAGRAAEPPEDAAESSSP